MIIWYREVTAKLINKKDINKDIELDNTENQEFEVEINNNEVFQKQTSKEEQIQDSSLCITTRIVALFKNYIYNDLDKFIRLSDLELKKKDRCSTLFESFHLINDIIPFSNKIELDRFYSIESTTSTVSSITHLEPTSSNNKKNESLNLEFESKFLIENITGMLLDIGCNEYTTFWINSTKVSNSYKFISLVESFRRLRSTRSELNSYNREYN